MSKDNVSTETVSEEIVEENTDYICNLGEVTFPVSIEIVNYLDYPEDSDLEIVAEESLHALIKTAFPVGKKLSRAWDRSAITKLLELKVQREIDDNLVDYLFDGVAAIYHLANTGKIKYSRLYPVSNFFNNLIKDSGVKDIGRLEASVNRLKMLSERIKRSENNKK